MHLDQDKITSIVLDLAAEEQAVLQRLESAATTYEQKLELQKTLEQVQDRQAIMTRLVTRNMMELRNVEKEVFVSTQLSKGQPPDDIREVTEVVNRCAKERRRGGYRFNWGIAEHHGGSFIDAILTKLHRCHHFLSIIPLENAGRWPLRPWLVEELGSVFPLPKFITICVERGVEKKDVGRMLGEQWPKLEFDRADTEWKYKLGRKLEEAMYHAADHQRDNVNKRLRLLQRAFGG